MKRPPDFKTGQRIGNDFKLEELLGTGQDGEVWQARRISINRRCALKFLNSTDDRDKRKRFEDEIKILAQLDHPHIVSIQDRGEAWNPTTGKDVPYYVMEFIPGLPVKEAILELPPNEQLDALCTLFQQILSALIEIHQAGISHGDIKSSNILVLKQQRIAKLTDFGFGLLFGDQRKREEYPTSSYKVPEQLTPQEADLYQLGKTLSDCMGSLPSSLLLSAKRALQRLIDNLIGVSPRITSSDAIQRLSQIQAAARSTNVFYEEILENVPELHSTIDDSILIHDPMHGDVVFSSRIVNIIDSIPFQHTRWIKEFPSENLIYPSLSVTRFELILGEFAALRQALMCVLDDRSLRNTLTADQLSILLLSCLLRRIGELPFESLLQAAIPGLTTPEIRSLHIIDSYPLKEIIAKHWGPDTQPVLDILFGKQRDSKTPTWHIVSWLLNHPLAPPNIERLRRIAWGCGFLIPDIDRFYYGLTLAPESRPEMVIKDSAIDVLEDIQRTRYLILERVIRHHAVRSADLMLTHAFAEIASKGFDFSTLTVPSDTEFLAECSRIAEKNGAGKASYLIKEYRERRLFKQLLVKDPLAKKSLSGFPIRIYREKALYIEEEIAKLLGVEKDKIILDFPQEITEQKRISILSGGRVIPSEDYSLLLKAMSDQMATLTRKIVLYCSSDLRDKFTDKIERVEELLRDFLLVRRPNVKTDSDNNRPEMKEDDLPDDNED